MKSRSFLLGFSPRCFAYGWILLAGSLGARPGWAAESDATPMQNVSQDAILEAVQDAVDAGVAAYQKGNLTEARRWFLEAWSLRPLKGIALSLAEIEMQLGMHLEAAEHWQYVLPHLDDPAQRTTAEEQLAECLRHLSRVHVHLDAPGSTIEIDGRVIEEASTSEELLVRPGTKVIQVTRPGYLPTERVVTVKPGESLLLRLHLQAVPEPGTTSSPPRLDDRTRRSDPTKGIVIIGGATLTVTAFAVGAVFGWQGNQHKKDAERWRERTNDEGNVEARSWNGQCHPSSPDRPPSCDQLRNSVERSNRSYDNANIAFVTGGVLGAATLVTWLLWPKSTRSKATDRDASWTLTPWSGAQARGLQLSGSF